MIVIAVNSSRLHPSGRGSLGHGLHQVCRLPLPECYPRRQTTQYYDRPVSVDSFMYAATEQTSDDTRPPDEFEGAFESGNSSSRLEPGGRADHPFLRGIPRQCEGADVRVLRPFVLRRAEEYQRVGPMGTAARAGIIDKPVQ